MSIPMVHRSPRRPRPPPPSSLLVPWSPAGMGRASSGRCYCPGRSERYPGGADRMPSARPKALVTAAVRGPGLDLLGELADLTLDSWLDQPTLRIYDAEQLADRMEAEGATIAVVESDRCAGPLFDLPLVAVGSCRGDPNNVDVAAATEAGVPVLRAPGRNADAVAELTVGLLFAATRGLVARRRRRAAGGHLQGRHHPLPALPGLGAGRTHRGSGGARRRRPGPPLAAARVSAWRSSPSTPTPTRPRCPSTSCSSAPTWCRCTRRSPRRPPA